VTDAPRTRDAASVAPVVADEPLPAAAASVAGPSAAPAAAAMRTDLASETPIPVTNERSSGWLTALLALGVIVLLSAPLAFVRRRKQQGAAQVRSNQARGNVQPSRARRPIDPVAGMDVVEGRLERAPSNEKAASLGSAKVDSVPAAGTPLPADLGKVALAVGPTDPVDLDVGAPVIMSEGVDWFADRDAPASSAVAVGDETIEENTVTAQIPELDTAVTVRQPSPQTKPDRSNRPVDDDQMTLTIVEMEMLRQDYEAQHTLTQQASQELREAIADLKATKAARAAAAETSTTEQPAQSQDDTTDGTADSTTARVRMK
jgi:hypothetical protein